MSSVKDGPEEQFNLDGILAELGSFGKYQLLLLLLLGFRDAFLLMCNLNYIFVVDSVGFRCKVPECEGPASSFNASWMEFALNATSVCLRTEPKTPYSDIGVASNATCTADNFIHGQTIPCDEIDYENYNSPVAEFDLGCQPWKAPLIGTSHNLGLVFSSVFYGLMSDRYGRKVIIVLTPLAVGVVGLLKSFSINYWMLLILEFIEAALGYGNASLVLSLETVSQQNRVIFTCIGDSLANFGGAFFGLIAWKFPYWRHTIRAIYSPLLVVVFYIFLVDEGVRWLFAHNKHDEAVRVLNKVAKVNNIKFSNKAKEMLVKVSEEKHRVDEKFQPQRPAHESPVLLTALRSRKIIFRVAVISAGFFCAMFVYNGTTVNITRILGNKYWNYSAMSLLAIPTRIVIAITLTKFGRRAPICIAYCMCALCLISSAFLSQTVSWWVSVVLYLSGIVCSTYALFSMTVLAMELFPTTSRNSLTNIAQTFGRLGGVLAPQTPLLERYMHGLPSISFGLAALGSAALATLLPDTSRAALPDNVVDAEHIDDNTPDQSTDKNDGETRIDVTNKPIWTTSLDLRTESRQSELSDVGCVP